MPRPHVRAIARALPPHRADQEELIGALREVWARKHFHLERLEELHRAVQVRARNLALPIEKYAELQSFRARNDAWIGAAVDLGARALESALSRADLVPTDVDHLFFVTVTGLATPSVDGRLVNRLGLRHDVQRTPIFGLGCVAGAAGLARAATALRGDPRSRAVLLSVELCSLTFVREDASVANVIASGLFGDGAAAVVLEGGDRPRAREWPEIVATRSVFFPNTERIMGWDFTDEGFKVVLSPKVPELVREHLRSHVDAFLEAQGLARSDVRHWIAHTGGPKVLEAIEDALQLESGALDRSWRSLRDVGNLSSASVLFVLADLLDDRAARPGDLGLLLAMGPGFCAELVLLRW